MKNLLIPVLLLLASTFSFGQCDKDVTLTSSKTEYLNSSGTLTRSKDEQSTIEINKSQVVITPGNPDHKMTGIIKSATCSWSTPYQEGKTVIEAVFEDPSGAKRAATLTTEGKAGVVTFLMEIADMPDNKIRVTVNSFQETKKN